MFHKPVTLKVKAEGILLWQNSVNCDQYGVLAYKKILFYYEKGNIMVEVEITLEKTMRVCDTFMVTDEQLESLRCGDNPFAEELEKLMPDDCYIEYDYAVNDMQGKTIVDWYR